MAAVLGSGHRAAVPSDRAFAIAVLVSVALHGVLLFGFNILHKPAARMVSPGPIVARLVQPRVETTIAPPQEAPKPEPPSTAPPPVQEKSAPRVPAPGRAAPEPRPAPRPAEPPPLAAPAQQPSPAPSVPAAPPPSAPAAPASPAASPPPPPESLAKADPQPPARSAPAPSAPAPSQVDAGTVERYRLDVINAASRYKTNPRVPGMRDIKETTAVVRMVIGANGLIASISVQKSAGHEVLDRNSVETMRKAKPLVQIPAALRGKEFSIEVPFIYQLKDEGA